MLSDPESLSATEQSILNTSVVSNITLPPDNNSKEEPTGMGTSLAKKAVPFVAPLPPPDVSLTSSTSAVTCEVCMLVNIRPMTTVVVLEGVV